LPPLKQVFRRRCCENIRSGFETIRPKIFGVPKSKEEVRYHAYRTRRLVLAAPRGGVDDSFSVPRSSWLHLDTGAELMSLKDKNVVVTGGNRGIGQALVEEALRRGAKRVYAGTRQPLAHLDGRVTPLTLDVTNAAQTKAAVERVESLDILINNAGLALYDDLSDRAALERLLAVNLFGTYDVTQAFLPLLTRSRGAIVNVLSVTAFAALPLIPAYSISKAAAFSLSQSLRAFGWTGREGTRRPDRSGGYGYVPRPRHPEGLSGIRCASHLRRSGERG
jgi:hypothetical protein